jgi:hypothetical protein
VLVGNNEIHMDCCGLLGCFYTSLNQEQYVSSSLAILQENGSLSDHYDSLKHEVGIEWYPLPTSRFKGVYTLLPSQILNLTSFTVEQRALPEPITGLSYDELLDKIVERLRFLLLNLSHSGKRILIALTAGYDSRLVLAATSYAKIKVETFTRVTGGTAYSDISLSKKLSRVSGNHHNYIKNTKFLRENEDVFDQHTAGNTGHVIKKAFANGQYDFFKKDDLLLSGTLFDVAKRNGYRKKMDAELNIETIFKAAGLAFDPNSYNFFALTKWLDWVEKTPMERLDWRDRFYLEQRIAGWASSLQQALDLIDADRLLVANCHELISLFLSIPAEQRINCLYHVDLINKMCPSLLQYPFNPPAPIFVRLRKKVGRIAKKFLSGQAKN